MASRSSSLRTFSARRAHPGPRPRQAEPGSGRSRRSSARPSAAGAAYSVPEQVERDRVDPGLLAGFARIEPLRARSTRSKVSARMSSASARSPSGTPGSRTAARHAPHIAARSPDRHQSVRNRASGSYKGSMSRKKATPTPRTCFPLQSACRQGRPEPTAHELDRVKLRALSQAERARTPRLGRGGAIRSSQG